MDADTRRIWWIALGLVLAVGAFFLLGTAQEELQPTPLRALVAIEAAESGVARLGPVEVAPGGRYTLHAVLEADSWQGDRVYYTEAEALHLPDGPVDPDRLRTWSSRDEVRVLWFSIEGAKPYQEIGAADDLDAFEFREFFLPDWPRTWSVSGLWGGTSAGVTLPEGVDGLPFGTRRFHVRIEVFGPESEIRPRERFQSWTAAELRDHLDLVPTVSSRLEGTLGPASSAFGLSQFEKAPGAEPEVMEALAAWRKRKLGFSRLTVIRASLDAAGIDPEALRWEEIEINGEVDWGAPGDLLRAGERWVLTYEDRGVPGMLDDDDLCFDFDKGAAVRRLGDIFVGEGLVERARLQEV